MITVIFAITNLGTYSLSFQCQTRNDFHMYVETEIRERSIQ